MRCATAHGMRTPPSGPILVDGTIGCTGRPSPPGGPVILLALLVPALMMAFLFAMDALENLLFPRPTATDDVTPATDASSP